MLAAWESKLERIIFVFASSTVLISISSRSLNNCNMLDNITFSMLNFYNNAFQSSLILKFKL